MNAFAANLIGASNSLTVTSRRVAVVRQGNGNFKVICETTFADGKRGYSERAMNIKTLAEAHEIARAA